MASYTLNQELNGIEVTFDSKPDSDTLTALKAAGYRWHRIKKVWYAKQTAERISIAARLTGQPDNSHLKHISYCKLGDTPEYNPGQWSNLRSLEKLTDNEKAALLTGYQEVKKAFMKRLNTYLKRYGLSKLNTWTYLSD